MDHSPVPSLPTVVLDTNVVLDLLLFHDPECVPLQNALQNGSVCWVATSAMRSELEHVLARGSLDAWGSDPSRLSRQWDRLCVEVPAPLPRGAEGRFRCTDPDDQKFIDLALACGARWLVSRDRAVLKLARRLGERGIEVVAPGGWAPLGAAAG